MITKNIYAVLTGDIVDSSKLDVNGRKRWLAALTFLLGMYSVNNKNHLGLNIHFEMYRGDSFQGVLEAPEQALRMALLIRIFLQSKIVDDGQIYQLMRVLLLV